jgi:hypothetical protein
MGGFANLSQMAMTVQGRWKFATLVAVLVAFAVCGIAAVLPQRFKRDR